MRRIEKSNDETMADMLEREGIENDIQFLFVGHPQLEGEGEEPEEPEVPCVLRGGSWGLEPLWLRGAARSDRSPRYSDISRGFRLAQD
jgi:hypothetical protein